MVPQNLAIPKGSLILVSGANGFIGSHVVDQLLQLDYNVRGTVRDEKPWLNKVFDDKYGKGRFETVVVPTIEKEGAFDDVLDGVSGFIHVVRLKLRHPTYMHGLTWMTRLQMFQWDQTRTRLSQSQ